ncbi:S41 family peptidase [Oceanirhabdus sp. W0125-5]|uniref:S41 family peptidase n=1 Tax=Oceanirhabdus sp. W0125-5 TaxID=2999116 RepID=UPI0022F30411|nr:S41 family peptidase [Oceanirhabdus sp. W0125-5]WBW98171.1 S41 family peptidase [Oceanirhabdus sp. W0125-5]
MSKSHKISFMTSKYFVALIVIIMFFVSLTGCYKIKNSINKMSSQDRLKLIELLEDAETLNNQGKYEEAIVKLTEAKEYNEEIASIYNKLSVSYYNIGEIEMALDNANKALSLGKKTSVVYTNKGNALYSLGRNEEALECVNKAIELDSEMTYAYYCKGLILYEKGEYEESKTAIEKADKLLPNHLKYIHKLFQISVALENYSEAKEYAEIIKKNHSEDYLYNLSIDELYFAKNSLDELLNFYKEYYEIYKDNPDAVYELGIKYYNIEKYRIAKKLFGEVYNDFKEEDKNIYLWMAYCEMELGEYDLSKEYLIKYESVFDKDSALYKCYGALYEYMGRYLKASEEYDKAMKEDSLNYRAVEGLISNLYYSMRYRRLLEAYDNLDEQLKEDEDFKFYRGLAYSQLNERDNAIRIFKELTNSETNGTYALKKLINEYMYNQDYAEAKKYANMLIEKDYEDEEAYNILEIINRRENSVMNQVIEFFNDNYLYINDTKIAEIAEKYKDKRGGINIISSFLQEVKEENDIFTYMIYGEDYRALEEEEYKSVWFKELDQNNVYVRVYGFDMNSDNLFIEGLDMIENKEEKTLIIDLRHNGGGLIRAANNIINQFLTGDVASNLIYRDGSTDSYYCDNDAVNFNEIKILVDEYTASSAELLALSLRSYLNNVEIIGRETFGKGVGQDVYDNKDMGFCIYVVSLYWNVKEKNIMENKISPDVYVKGNKLEDYLDVFNVKWKHD